MEHRPTSANKILEVALDLFGSKGYEGTSIREICERAAITRPTLYYFYGNKEGVYQALVTKAMQEFQEDILNGLREHTMLAERYKAAARKCFADAVRRPALWRFIMGLIWAAPKSPASAELQKLYPELLSLLARAAEEAVQQGEVAPGSTQIRMLALVGAMGETLSNYLLLGTPKLTPQFADELVDTILNGWKVQV